MGDELIGYAETVPECDRRHCCNYADQGACIYADQDGWFEPEVRVTRIRRPHESGPETTWRFGCVAFVEKRRTEG